MIYYDDRNREYTINRLSQYMDDKDTTEDLRKCCERCEQYCGSEHDYGECNCPILELWREVKFWRSLNLNM